MPFDNTGTFNRIHSWEQDRQDGISIDSYRVDEDTDDIANGLSSCMLRDGSMAMEGALDMANFKITNLANGTASSDAVNKGQLDSASSTLNAAITTAVNTMLSSLYPVGSIYIGTQNTCPLTSLISGSAWTLVSSGKALWTGNGSNGNSTIAAGLPNITGTFKAAGWDITGSGAFSGSDAGNVTLGTSGNSEMQNISFSAKNSNAIYGKSSTVQPPAYVVNVWRRTA